jgi:hypothetical protein
VPSPEKGPLAPLLGDGAGAEVVDGGGGCGVEVVDGGGGGGGVDEGAELVRGDGLLWGVLTMAVTAGIVEEGAEEECGIER